MSRETEQDIARRVFDMRGSIEALVEYWRSPRTSQLIENEAGDIEDCAAKLKWLAECVVGSLNDEANHAQP